MAKLIMTPKEYGKKMRSLNRTSKSKLKSSMRLGARDLRWFKVKK